MRQYSYQVLLNWSKLFFKKGYWDAKWLVDYGWEWFVPNFNTNKKKNLNRNLNKIFDRRAIRLVREDVKQLGRFNSGWFQRIFEPETFGIRAWEYGTLLKKLKNSRQKGLKTQLGGQANINKKKILDIGTGPSLLPEYLASLGAEVVSLDIKKSNKPWLTDKQEKIEFVQADMCQMPFGNNQFDLVISISAIEHLDNWEKTKLALKEMARVCRPGGMIYLTTDFYLRKQKTDNWNSGGKPKEAYSWDKLAEFVEIFADAGVEIDFPVGVTKKLLLSSPRFSNYRGRYFTTANFFGRKTR